MRNGDPTSHSYSSERLHILAVCKLHNFMVNWMFVFADWCQDVLSAASSSLTVIDAKKLWWSTQEVQKHSQSMRFLRWDTFAPLESSPWQLDLINYLDSATKRGRARILLTSPSALEKTSKIYSNLKNWKHTLHSWSPRLFSLLPSRLNSIALASAELERMKSKTKLFHMRSEKKKKLTEARTLQNWNLMF